MTAPAPSNSCTGKAGHVDPSILNLLSANVLALLQLGSSCHCHHYDFKPDHDDNYHIRPADVDQAVKDTFNHIRDDTNTKAKDGISGKDIPQKMRSRVMDIDKLPVLSTK